MLGTLAADISKLHHFKISTPGFTIRKNWNRKKIQNTKNREVRQQMNFPSKVKGHCFYEIRTLSLYIFVVTFRESMAPKLLKKVARLLETRYGIRHWTLPTFFLCSNSRKAWPRQKNVKINSCWTWTFKMFETTSRWVICAEYWSFR